MAVSPDPQTNPYAPPAAGVGAVAQSTKRSKYESERRSVLLMVLLTIVTVGQYPLVWYVRRARFLDSLNADEMVDPLQWIAVCTNVVSLVLSMALGWMHVQDSAAHFLARLLQIAGGVTVLALSFRIAHILRSDFARTGRYINVSGVAVFFLGCLYLQHVINAAADTPASRPKRGKKRGPPVSRLGP
jgi:hypothetical protein